MIYKIPCLRFGVDLSTSPYTLIYFEEVSKKRMSSVFDDNSLSCAHKPNLQVSTFNNYNQMIIAGIPLIINGSVFVALRLVTGDLMILIHKLQQF